MEYLIYILIGWGLTDFLVNGSILDKIRVYFLVKFPLFAKLLSCIRCSGFWVGAFLGTLPLYEISPFYFFEEEIFVGIRAMASGFLIAGSSVIINALIFSLYYRGITPNKENITDEEN